MSERYYRAELVYRIPRQRLEQEPHPERFVPKGLRLIDEDGTVTELQAVRGASISFGLDDARVLNVSLIVRGVTEVFEEE